MQRVTMKQTRVAAIDGVHDTTLLEGETYELPDGLAGRYLERGLAVVPEAKDAGPAVENKDAGPAPQKKTTTRRKPRAAPAARSKRA